MNFRFLQGIVDAVKRAAKRFPGAVICGITASFAGILVVGSEGEGPWLRLFFAGSLGLPLFTSVVLLGERHRVASGSRWIFNGLSAAFLVVLYFLFGRWEDESQVQRYFHLSATLHMAAAMVPYLGVREPNGFWQFNRALFFRFGLAGIYAGALYLGLALALAAIDNLLGIAVPDETYERLFFLNAFIVHPLFFLAGVPSDFADLERNREYPAGLKVFSQYVMLPLVAVYVTILTVYMGKILVTGTWPSGWISYLVSSLAVGGIFSLLMVHPERLREERGWIHRYALAFWISILPSAVMVLLALWQRFQQYGITERRYLLGVLAVWLAGTAIYHIVTRTREIRGIPFSLAVVGAITFVGPWSAYSVAERSQVSRIEGILSASGVLSDDEVSPGPWEIPFEDWLQVEGAVRYLVENHGTSALQPWMDGGLPVADTASGADQEVSRILQELGLRPAPGGRSVQIRLAGRREPVSVVGFERMVIGEGNGEVQVGGDPLQVALSQDSLALVLRLGDREEARASVAPLIERAEQPGRVPAAGSFRFNETERVDVPGDVLALDLSGDTLSALLLLRSITLEDRTVGWIATGFSFDAVLLRRNEEP